VGKSVAEEAAKKAREKAPVVDLESGRKKSKKEATVRHKEAKTREAVEMVRKHKHKGLI
jgi:hypothetical protein